MLAIIIDPNIMIPMKSNVVLMKELFLKNVAPRVYSACTKRNPSIPSKKPRRNGLFSSKNMKPSVKTLSKNVIVMEPVV